MATALETQKPWTSKWWNWFKNDILIILIPALTTVFINRFLYILARLVTHNIYSDFSDFFCLKFPFEGNGANGMWPFLPGFIIPYVFCYIYWIAIPFCINKILGRRAFFRFCFVSLIAWVISFFLFVLMPSNIPFDKPYFKTVTDWTAAHKDNNVLGFLCNMVYGGDQPDNLFPSGHNLATFIPVLACLDFQESKKKKVCIPLLLGTTIFYIIVLLATLFLRQHFLLDAISAIALSCITYWGVKYIPWLQKGVTGFDVQTTNWNVGMGLEVTSKKRTISAKLRVLYISLYVICILIAIYFCVVTLFTGDPFKSLWAWGAKV